MKEDAKRIKRTVGRRIRERRVELELSRETLAELVDVSNQYVAKCESGSQNVTVETLVKFANALDTTVVALLTPSPKKAAPVGPSPKKAAAPAASAVTGKRRHRQAP